MEFTVKSCNLETQNSDCVIIAVFESCCLSPIAEKINNLSKGYLSTLLDSGEIEGKIGQMLLLYHVPNILYKRILLVGCGKANELNEYQYKDIIKKTTNKLNQTGVTEAIWLLTTDLHIKNRNNYWKIRQAVETIEDTLYLFNKFKNTNIHSGGELRRKFKKIIFNVPQTQFDLTNGELAVQHGLAIATGIKAAKDLANMPPNLCNSSYLATKARQLADNHEDFHTQIIGEEQMRNLAMNAYLAVGQGSQNESFMSVIEFKGNKDLNHKPIVLVGKGLTFDSGGISIKPSDGMDEMKYDMCGAAAVYGVMRFIAEIRPPLNVIGVLAGCENMPSGKAYRPGDIITTMSGKTVEVLNTDAEGRLVLCDTLTYVERFDPNIVIDIATLTGACVIALGKHYNGLMSNNNLLAKELLTSANQSGDKTWRLPLDEEFSKQLESNFANIANTGGRAGGVVTAGCFLEHFANKYHWAHLDIAGTAWESGKNKGATGRPVSLLSQFILNRANIICDN